jgi:succinate-acetate transporter protein
MPAPSVAAAVGDPSPLSLSGLALAVFALGLANTGLLNGVADIKMLLAPALLIGGVTQLLAGMWDFRAGSTFGATASTLLGAFWLSLAALLLPGFGLGLTAVMSPKHPAMGWYLLAFAIITAVLMLGALRISGAHAAVYILLFLTLLLIALGQLTGSGILNTIGGWIGILTAIVAAYTALAALLRNVTAGAIALPTYPLG